MRVANPFLLVAVSLLLLSCATYPTQNQANPAAGDEQWVSEATREVVACAKRNVRKVDDLMSDAQSVALVLAASCRDEYNHATTAVSYARLENEPQRREFRRRRNLATQKIETFLPAVIQHRAELRKNNHK